MREVDEDKDNKIKVEMTREEYDRVKKEYTVDKEHPPKKKLGFNSFFPMGKRQAMNKSLKKPDGILVFLLNLKGCLEGPILTKIYGGNFLVIRNHVYRFNPSRVFTFGKWKVVIAREFDRELIGIDDYTETIVSDYASKNPGQRVNFNDPVLIKAVIAAHLSEKPKAAGGSTWIIVAVVVLGLIIGFFALSKKKTTPTGTISPPNVNITG